jgi:sugar lactone lactonase YvrE
MRRFFVFTLLIHIFLVTLPTMAHATLVGGQYAASNVLGQYAFEDSSTVSYTKGTANSWNGTVNAYNLDRGDGAIVLDKTRDKLYIADDNNNRVLVFDTDASHNVPYGEAADYVLGQANLTSSLSGTSDTRLNSATSLALDETNGRLFVGDGGSCRVVVYDVSGTITNGMAADNVLFQPNFTSNTCNNSLFWDSGNLDVVGITGVTGLAYDATNDYLYVSDRNKDRVLAVDVATITNGEAAQGILGDQTGDYSLDQPMDMVIDDNGQLFVTDLAHNRVLVYDISTFTSEENPVYVLGQSNFTGTTGGAAQNTFIQPIGIDIDESSDQLAVGDSDGRLLIFDVSTITNGENATNILGRPNFTDTNADGTVSLSYTAPQIHNGLATFGVSGVHWVDSNTLLAHNQSRVMEFDTTTITNGEAAQNLWGQYDWGGNIRTDTIARDGDLPSVRDFSAPADIALDTENNRLYVADSYNSRVLVFNVDPTTHIPLDRDADYVLGQSNFSKSSITSPATASKMSPIALAVDSVNDRLFVTDENFNRVLVYDVATITNGEDAVYVLGQDDFASSSYDGTSATDFEDPGQLYYSETDEWLFVVDQYSYRVLLFDLSSGITNGMAASKVIGQADFTSATDCVLDASGFCDAEGQIVFDEVNRTLFVSDPYDYRILVFELPADLSTMSNDPDASYVIGQSDFASSDTTPVATRMDEPYGLAYSDAGMLFAFDCNNNRIIAYDVSTLSTDPTPMGVIGQANFTTSTGGTSQTKLDCAYRDGMDFDDENQRLFVADGDNNRVLSFDFVTTTTTSLSAATEEQVYSQSIATTRDVGTVSSSLLSGTLPAGMTVSGSGLGGTPTATAAGSYSFTIKSNDDAGTIGSFFDARQFSLTVLAAGGSSSTSGSSATSSEQTSDGACTDLVDNRHADLFQIATKKRQATLYFSPVPGISKYIVFYGLSGQPWQYSSVVEGVDTSGVVDHHIYHLAPDTAYDFFVVPYNGCAAGPSSSTLAATTNYGIYHKYTDVVYQNPDRGVLGSVLGAAAGWFDSEEATAETVSKKESDQKSVVTKKTEPKVEAKTTNTAPSMEVTEAAESSQNLPWYQKLWNSVTGLFK